MHPEQYDGPDRRHPTMDEQRMRVLERSNELLTQQLAEVVLTLSELPGHLRKAVSEGVRDTLSDRETLATAAEVGRDMLVSYGKRETGGWLWGLVGGAMRAWALPLLLAYMVYRAAGTEAAAKFWASVKV